MTKHDKIQHRVAQVISEIKWRPGEFILSMMLHMTPPQKHLAQTLLSSQFDTKLVVCRHLQDLCFSKIVSKSWAATRSTWDQHYVNEVRAVSTASARGADAVEMARCLKSSLKSLESMEVARCRGGHERKIERWDALWHRQQKENSKMIAERTDASEWLWKG